MTAPLAEASVVVLAGGRSSEHEVSLESGRAVVAALSRPDGPGDRRGPREVRAVTIDADGRWLVGEESLAPERALAQLADVDLFFLALHGGEGENGVVQGLLAACDRPFTGSGVTASAVCMDKVHARAVMASVGVEVAPAVVVDGARWRARSAEVRAELARLGDGGWAVKPRASGSSVAVSLVRAVADLGDALEEVLARDDDALVEALVHGTEATVGVLDEPAGPRALPPVEIRPHEGRFYDYHEKYDDDGASLICPPETLDAGTSARLAELGLRAHGALGCEGYSRSDFVVRPDGAPVFIETNTLPGLTSHSLVPLEARTIGVDFRSLCLAIAADGLARGARR